MDVQMPVMDGLEATRRLRQLPGGQDVWIIAITANVTPEDRARCFAAGMDEFIPKPIEPSELRDILGARVGRSRLKAGRLS
jgi:CheY-like chemotaxis protein